MSGKQILIITALSSIIQCTFQTSAMGAPNSRSCGTSLRQELKLQLRQAVQHVKTAHSIGNTLTGTHAAISQGNLPLYNQHKKQLLKLIKKNPDMLWHKARWNDSQEQYLIDSVSPFDLAVNAWITLAISSADAISSAEHYRAFLDSMSDTYAQCLALSNRPILSPSAKRSYLGQLERRSRYTENIEDYVKLTRTLIYLGDVDRCNTFNTVTTDTLPRDIRGLITSFCLGQTPKSEQRLEAEAHLIKMRKTPRAGNEANCILKARIERSVSLDSEELALTPWDRTVMRALIRSGLTQSDLLSQSEKALERPVFRLKTSYNISAAMATAPLVGLFATIGLELDYYLYLRSYYGPNAFSMLKDTMELPCILGFFYIAGLLMFLRKLQRNKRALASERANFEANKKALYTRWKDIARAINETRFSFEKDVENLPNVIPVPSVAQENDLELE